MDTATKPVGLIGLGLMGMACAKRMRGAGLPLLGYDIDTKKIDGLVKLGGAGATSLAQIATECDQVVLAVFNTDQVEETVDALVKARPAGKPALIACCVSTCDPDRIAALVARTPADKLRYVESPVSGTSDQTEKGDALGMIGGDPAAAEIGRAHV